MQYIQSACSIYSLHAVYTVCMQSSCSIYSVHAVYTARTQYIQRVCSLHAVYTARMQYIQRVCSLHAVYTARMQYIQRVCSIYSAYAVCGCQPHYMHCKARPSQSHLLIASVTKNRKSIKRRVREVYLSCPSIERTNVLHPLFNRSHVLTLTVYTLALSTLEKNI